MSVQFCVGECKPVSCSGDKQSFGRRKRSITPAPHNDFSIAMLPSMSEQGEPVANSLVYDDSLEQEIIEGDTDLSKEIYVEAGTTVDRIRDPYGLESLDEDGELVCTTMTVVIAASIAIVLLQVRSFKQVIHYRNKTHLKT